MKKIVFLLLLSGALSACNNSEKSIHTLDGKININTKDTMVYGDENLLNNDTVLLKVRTVDDQNCLYDHCEIRDYYEIVADTTSYQNSYGEYTAVDHGEGLQKCPAREYVFYYRAVIKNL